MCANCKCGVLQDDMGNVDNITDKTLTALGQKWGGMDLAATELAVVNYLSGQPTDPAKVADMEIMFDKASKAWGQPIEEGKAETLKLLKRELNM